MLMGCLVDTVPYGMSRSVYSRAVSAQIGLCASRTTGAWGELFSQKLVCGSPVPKGWRVQLAPDIYALHGRPCPFPIHPWVRHLFCPECVTHLTMPKGSWAVLHAISREAGASPTPYSMADMATATGLSRSGLRNKVLPDLESRGLVEVTHRGVPKPPLVALSHTGLQLSTGVPIDDWGN
jgi:hypothetical protein